MQARRYLSMARFFLVTLHRRPVTLHNFQAGVAAEYASHHFERPLQALEMLQLALRAGFSLAAAASLNSIHSAHFTVAPQLASPDPAARHRQPGPGASAAAIPAWRYRFFMWWLRR